VLAAVAAAAALAAGPAGAVTAAPGMAAARATTARTTMVARPAAGHPLRSWAASLLPGRPGAASAVKGSLTLSPQAHASGIGFSGATLYGVSCTGRKECTATGMASTRNGQNLKPLADRWNGTTWARQTTPTTNSGGLLGGTLSGGVSCTSSTACIAAGYSYGSKGVQPLGEGWNGRTWSVQPGSTPIVNGSLFHISCTWAKDCVAVGSRAPGATLAEHWNGLRWSAETTKHTGELDGVSCPATGNCTAVGYNNASRALAAHWNGKAWSDESPADPQPLSLLESVSCPATTACIAVGAAGTDNSALALAPLAEQWTGSNWTPLTFPSTPATDLVELYSVSCTSATNCIAVGDDQNSTGTADTTLAAQWNGTTWTLVSPPSPATFSALFSVSCTSATFCSAVGASSPSATGAVSPVAETWNGATWSLQTAAG
jgi:hypothetical protein